MSSTRAASAASSRRAKQRLVQFLFGKKYSGKGREAHKKLDHASYSFDDLRAAFLERVHEIHPDKRRGNITETDTSGHHEFVELQSAWAEYEKLAKMMTKVGSGSSDANFTLFGVGCSFSDSEEERDKRSQIADEAARGYFISGIITETAPSSSESGGSSDGPMRETSIVDDDLFVSISDDQNSKEQKDDSSIKPQKRKALVDIPKFLQKRAER